MIETRSSIDSCWVFLGLASRILTCQDRVYKEPSEEYEYPSPTHPWRPLPPAQASGACPRLAFPPPRNTTNFLIDPFRVLNSIYLACTTYQTVRWRRANHQHTMNKNWNDRADKDLFFTILSVKNIGVISGSEWTTIGNHMRTLGYGFTNEGCR